MVDVLCLGELLVDWVCTTMGAELNTAQVFTKAPGGAPANTAVGLARQGIGAGFLGRVSGDAFGLWLRSVLEENNVDSTGTITDPDAQTRMAYVVTTAAGDRKLAEFSKISCADARIEPDDLKPEMFAAASVLHFGSISMIASPAAEATKLAVELARQNHLFVSYDPNVRPGLWPSANACRQKILDTLNWADMVKINEDELEFLTGSRDLLTADSLRRQHDLALLVVTLDSRGAYFTSKAGSQTVAGFSVQLVEATGAGDGFNSGMIGGLLPYLKAAQAAGGTGENYRRAAVEALSVKQLSQVVQRSNAIGALACTRAGAIPALPTSAEIDAFMSQAALQV